MSEKYKPTDADKHRVKVLVSQGYSQDDIAVYLDVDAKTLRKHFRRELNNGAKLQEADELVSLALAAERGNVSASRELNRRIKEKNSVATTETGRAAQQVAKDIVAQNAHVGTSWADILPKETLGEPMSSEARRPIKKTIKRNGARK